MAAYWLCRTSDCVLSGGKISPEAKANNLQLDDVPVELSTRNALEVRLISPRVPFMEMDVLWSGRLQSIRGPAVNVSSDLDRLCSTLSSLPTETDLIALQIETYIEVQRQLCTYDCVS